MAREDYSQFQIADKISDVRKYGYRCVGFLIVYRESNNEKRGW